MYGKKLTDAEIATRMVELRNLRKLHAHDREQIGQLKAESSELRTLVAAQAAVIEKLQIQVAELQTMVFGKKKKTVLPPDDEVSSSGSSAAPRTPESYRRPLPPATAITAE